MKCAYVTLVMLGNDYVKGAIALAKSLIKSRTGYDLICMVTRDVTQIRELSRLYTRIVVVDYIYHECGKMLTKRQNDIYSKWINFSFTKWRCFELIEYDKCVYLDADQLVLRNIDHVFHLPGYAMCFNHNYNPHFKTFHYGDLVTSAHLKFIYDNCTILGFSGTLVYTPSLVLASQIARTVPSMIDHSNRHNNGFDEIVLTKALIDLNIDVRQLSPMYVWNAGDYSILKNSQPYVINYYGDKKPWMKNKKSIFMDVFIWKYFYNLKVYKGNTK